MLSKLIAYPVMGLLWLIGQLPWGVLKVLSRIVFVVIYYFPGYRRDVVTLNMIYALPDMNGEELRRAQKAFYLHLSELIFEVIKGFFIAPDEMKTRIRLHVDAQAMIRKWEADKRHVVMLMGHYGNWEWANLYGGILTALQSYGVYTPMSSKVWDAYFLERRCRWNCRMLPPKAIKAGLGDVPEYGSLIGLVADQSPTGRNNTFSARFLGLETSFFTGPDFLSKMLQADVIYVQMHKIGFGKYDMNFLHICDTRVSNADMILPTYIKTLETEISSHPEWWIWTHKRWKGLIKY
jgi:KDO2-lipid IV(A) lauroyltransferase